MCGAAIIWRPRCIWRWKQPSGFTPWFGGWEHAWWRSANSPATRKFCSWAIRHQIYAESILKTCEFCVGSPLACVSGVTGAELKKRIVRIMTPTLAEKLSRGRRLLLASVGIAAVSGPVLFGLWNTPRVRAQSAQAPSKSVAAPRIYHVGGDVSAPQLIFSVDPDYSAKAKRARYQGVCVISLVVDAEGNPQRVQVVRHLGKGLDQKAVEAVKQYRFKPGMLHGNPVAVQVNIEVNFRLY